MATKIMLRTSKNNVPLQLLRLMKDKTTTVPKSFPTFVDRSVFCGGTTWTTMMPRKDEEVKDGFIREMRNGNLELFEGKSIGAVEVRGPRMVSDEDADDEEEEEEEDDEELEDLGDDCDEFDSDEDEGEEEDVRK